MSARTTLRALPTLLRIGLLEATAYRAEMLIWVLSTSMPLVMLLLWRAVAAEAPVGRFGPTQFSGYFLMTFCVRQLTGSWIGWQMNFEVRHGTLSMRLLRPLPPVVAYAVEHVAAMPMRVVVVLPVAVLAAAVADPGMWPRDPWVWLLFLGSLAGGWMINFLAQFAIGAVSFFLQSSLKVIDLWFVGFMVFSGYLFPLELLPARWRPLFDVLPFRFQQGLPVEIVTGSHGRLEALHLVALQWGWVGVFSLGAAVLWRNGLRRFAAYGG